MVQSYLLLAGVMLCSNHVCSPGWARPWSPDLGNGETALILRQLQRVPSQKCLKDRTDFKFPWKSGKILRIQKTEAASCFYHEMLQQILSLFSTEDSHAAWDESLRDELLSRLHLSLDRLELTSADSLFCPSVGIEVRKYFQRITRYLKEKEYSACAWEVVRVEIGASFSLINHRGKVSKK